MTPPTDTTDRGLERRICTALTGSACDGVRSQSIRFRVDGSLRAAAHRPGIEIHERDIRSVAIPALGGGLGGLRWDEVRPLIAAALESLGEARIVIFEPRGEAS